MKRFSLITALGFGLGLYLLFEREVKDVRWAITPGSVRHRRLVDSLLRDYVSAA